MSNLRLMTAHEEPSPSDLSSWGLHAFCLGASRTPQGVIALDDNGALLVAARHGTRRAHLEARGFCLSESRLALLKLFHLIEGDGDHLVTSFPLLDGESVHQLRLKTKVLAHRIVPMLKDDILRIHEGLTERGHAGHTYSIFFGHAIDGLLWEGLRGHGMLPETQLTPQRPLWNGALWGVYPERADCAGVNERTADGGTVVSVWSNETAGVLRALAVDDSIVAQVPAISTTTEDGVDLACQRIARRVQQTALESSDLSHLLDSLDTPASTAAVIVFHELIWDIMEAPLPLAF